MSPSRKGEGDKKFSSGEHMHPRGVLHRVGNKANLEQLNIGKLTPCTIAAARADAVAERQPGHRAALQRSRRAAIGCIDPGSDAQAALVLRHTFHPADADIGPVLPQQRERGRMLGKAAGKGTRCDHISASIALPEQRGIAGEAERC